MNYVALAACPSVLVMLDRWLEPVRINNRCVWDDYIKSPVRKFGATMLTVKMMNDCLGVENSWKKAECGR